MEDSKERVPQESLVGDLSETGGHLVGSRTVGCPRGGSTVMSAWVPDGGRAVPPAWGYLWRRWKAKMMPSWS